MKNKPVTVWKKFNVKSQKWDHNHIEDGHVSGNKPIGNTTQTKNWDEGTWIYEQLYITKDYKVIMENVTELKKLKLSGKSNWKINEKKSTT